VAELTGFSSSTLRYYEDVGLLPDIRRSEGGYRVYDDRVVRRLQLIARAKELGLSLTEIAEVASIWDGDECAPVQARLVSLIAKRARDARARIAQLERFTDDLEDALAMLGDHTADGACDDQCGCTTGATMTTERVSLSVGHAPRPPEAQPIVCTLEAESMVERMEDWRNTLLTAVRAESIDGGAHFDFPTSTNVAELANLAAAEQSCCSFLTFGLGIEPNAITLEIRGPAEARELLDEFVALSR
jgi:DNA-binding transcriptional MerR regulator